MRDSGLHNYCLICPGKAFKKSTVIELFKEPDINIKDPDWCKIYEVLLNQQHKKFEETEKQQNTEHAHQGNNYYTCGATIVWQ